MKATLFFLLSLQTLFVNAQTKTDWEKDGLKGKVKSIKTDWTYRYKKDGKNFTPWKVEDGNLKTFSAKGQAMSIQYLKEGKDMTSTSKYIYTPATNSYEIKGYSADGRMYGSTLYKTDVKGNILEEIRLDSAGQLRDSYKYTYDGKGNQLGYGSYAKDGKLRGRTLYTYNSLGQKTENKTETTGYATSYIMYEYDAKGNVSMENHPPLANLPGIKFERFYDDKNNKIREVKYITTKPKSYTSTWVYEYDSKGNWIKQTEYSDEGEPYSVYERTIVYY